MGALEYFRSAMKKLHDSYREAVSDLTPEQLHFRPLDRGNSIAFMLWHVVRTEDTVVNFAWQKKPPVWNAEAWDKKFGMDPKAQGTGMTAEQAAALRISDLGEFRKYMENVFKASEAFLDSASEKQWEEVKELTFLGKRDLYQLIGGIVLQHGSGHLGEIWYVKGILGLKGSPI
jgi:DinB superfamily